MMVYSGFSLLILEALCLLLILVVFLADLLTSQNRKDRLAMVSVGGLLIMFLVALFSSKHRGVAFKGMYLADSFAFLFKTVFITITIFVTVMAREFLRKFSRNQGEFYLLILSVLLGMLFLTSANDFILLFVSLELVTLSLYVMTAYLKTEATSVEAGIKYLILGSLSSGLMLYGISFIYGNTGSTNFNFIHKALSETSSYAPSLLFGVLLLIVGLGFKVGSVPFHLWIPDVYEGAPVPVTAFLSVGSKLAGFAVFLRIFFAVISPIAKNWAVLFSILSALTLLYGNLGALPQKNIKRFLGYSSIGHAGYLLMGFAAGDISGGIAMVFYLLAYGVSVLAAFLVVVFCSVHLESDSMEAYDGLSERSPLLAAALFISLLSLAGVPPLAGFFAKFLILSSVVNKGLIWLALLGAVNVVISLYYYLVIVKRMYMDRPHTTDLIRVSLPFRFCLYAALLAIIGMGVVQGPFVRIASAAISSLLS